MSGKLQCYIEMQLEMSDSKLQAILENEDYCGWEDAKGQYYKDTEEQVVEIYKCILDDWLDVYEGETEFLRGNFLSCKDDGERNQKSVRVFLLEKQLVDFLKKYLTSVCDGFLTAYKRFDGDLNDPVDVPSEIIGVTLRFHNVEDNVDVDE